MLHISLLCETWNVVLHDEKAGAENTEVRQMLCSTSPVLISCTERSKCAPQSVGVLVRLGVLIVLKFMGYVTPKMNNVSIGNICE